ncbi:60S ribosomal protein L7 [Anaeramoeba ignava]|uniref:60S ribosomal protein L7 n=1 Tax=Anaeramoeba ignava TaxID=1746090 RepID=A0A9Q0LI91_ANAIG|nr:60S ribosomal protein L7 [Anaeramoeba ignava]
MQDNQPKEEQKIIPETLKKKKEQIEKIKQERQKKREQQIERQKKNRQLAHDNAAKYEEEYKKMERDLVEKRRAAKAEGNIYVEPEPKLALVIRIKGITGVAPRQRKILQLMRLRQINNAVFIKLNKTSLRMLHFVAPYIAWGYPTLGTIRKLIYKRGYGKIRSQRIPLLTNEIIAKRLGKKNIVSVEDIVHEIYTVGPNFKYANNFLWPFKLNTARGGLSYIKRNFIEGGDAGNREEYINKLVKRMI